MTWEEDAYWDWSWAEMGIYDDMANIKMVKERSAATSDKKKISYLGYS